MEHPQIVPTEIVEDCPQTGEIVEAAGIEPALEESHTSTPSDTKPIQALVL